MCPCGADLSARRPLVFVVGEAVLLAVGFTVLAFGFLFLAFGLPFVGLPSPGAVLATLGAGAVFVFAGLAYGLRHASPPPVVGTASPNRRSSGARSAPLNPWEATAAPTVRRFTVRSPALSGELAPAVAPRLPATVSSLAVEGTVDDGPPSLAPPGSPGPARASLSFSPAIGGSGTSRPTGEEASHTAFLRREVDQLRARLREVEGMSRRSGAVAGLPSAFPARTVAEPPAMRESPLTALGSCANCGNRLPHGPRPSLCWGCGRPMCSDCYWHHGSGPEAHRCSSCLARLRATDSGPVATTGGGLVTPSRGVSPDSAGDGAPPTPGR